MTLRLSTELRDTLLGTTLVTNGKFTTDTDPPPSWTAVDCTPTTEASGQEGNCCQISEAGAGTYGYIYQSITIRSGVKYRIEGFFKNVTADSGIIKVGTAADGTQYYTSGALTDVAWAKKVGTFVSTGVVAVITLGVEGESDECLFDEILLAPVSSLKDIFDGGSIKIYTGTQPASADTAPSGTLLVTIQNGGSGITWDAADAGSIAKAAAETWSGVCGNTGTAGWFRIQAAGDLGTTNTTDCRIDGAVATSGSQLNVSSTAFVSGATETITSFAITMPAA